MECFSARDAEGGLFLRVLGDKPNGLVVSAAAASIINRTVGGLIELARSELDEAILA